METQEKKDQLKPLSPGRRYVKFFDITGHSLVHPFSYNMQGFQKQIIMTAIFRNTLISLPPGLGMPYLASVIVFNFQRWFLNGKIVVLSQTKSCIVDLMNGYSSYTTLSSDSYSDLFGNTATDSEAAWNKPIVLSSPMKFLDSIQTKMCRVNDLILLIVYETSKITKCQEYKDIMTLLSNLDFRVNVFIEGCGINTKAFKQIIETFSISQIEIRNLTSPDITDCTFRSEIESVSLEISPHMVNIKDAFFAVFEKYGKLLKDAKVITGNVASFTKNQVQKAREKLIKAPPQNMNKDTLQNLLNAMTMCSFLCVGIDILHNWGVRSFYNYLFDENKDGELKRLIVKDELLKNQMKLLNEYLKSHGKMESLISRIIHPKLIYLKNLILRSFSEAEGIIDDFRMVIFSSMDEIIDDVDRLISTLPNFIRHQCVRTKSKSLSNTNDYKEVVRNFNGGVINVLVLNNLVEEINDLKTNLIVSLEPSRPLLKFSDPKFYKGTEKCFFILTKGNEYLKFETLLNEKKNEQKTIELPVVDHILQDSPTLFPEGFNPDFEGTSVGPLVHKSDHSATQKTMLNFLNPETGGKSKKSISFFNDSDFIDSSIFVSKNAPQKLPSPKRSRSPSIFEGSISRVNDTDAIDNYDDFHEQLYPSPQAIPYSEQIANSKASRDLDDSCEDLILDFAVPHQNKPKSKSVKTEDLSTSQSSDKENIDLEIIDDEISKCDNDMNHNNFKATESDSKTSIMSRLQKLRDCAANLTLDFNNAESSDHVENPESVSKSSLFDVGDEFFEDFDFPAVPNDKVKEVTFEYSKDDTRLGKNSRTSIDMVNATEQNPAVFRKDAFKEVTLFGSFTDDAETSKNSRSSIDMVDETRRNSTNLNKYVFKEKTLFDSSKNNSELGKNSRTSIDVVNDTRPNPTTSKKDTFKETSLFGNSKDNLEISQNSRTSFDFVNETRQNPITFQKNLFKEKMFGSSKNDSELNKNSRTSIDIVNDTGPNLTISKKNPFKETTLFGNSKSDAESSENSRTSVYFMNETRPNSTIPKPNPFKETTQFDSSKKDFEMSKNSRTSIDFVNETRPNPTIRKPNSFKETTPFDSSKNDFEMSKNSRTSIDFVNETRPNPTIQKPNPFKETRLFKNSKNDSKMNKNSRSSIDFVNETRPNLKKNLFKQTTLFNSFKNHSKLDKTSQTSINVVNDTRPNPFSPKSSIFSAKNSTLLAKNNEVPLKDRSASIHFGSSFEFDDDFTIANLCPDEPTEKENPPEFSPKSKPVESKRSDDSSEENEDVEEKLLNPANVDDWDPDCELFQDEDDFDNIITPPKVAASVKTSTPISKPKETPKEASPATKDTPIIDLVSPQKPVEQTNRPELKKTSPVGSSISTELPKPTRSLKSFSTDTCDINISDNPRKKAITNSYFSNFSLSLKQKCSQNQNTQSKTTNRCKIDDDDDFPWMKTTAKPPQKAKLKTNSDDDESLYPWLKKSPAKLASSTTNSCGSSWLKKSPAKPVYSSATNSCGSSWLKKSPVNQAPSSKTNSGGSSWLKKSPVESTTNSCGSWLKKSPLSATSSSPNTPKLRGISNVANRASCSTTNNPSIAHSTPDFKKPSPFVIRSSASKSAQSSSGGSDGKSVSDGSTPELQIIKNKKKKTNLKRNLAMQFLDNEAEVSSGGSDDTIIEDRSDVYENDSFIDDEVTNKKSNISHYLKSIKSPGTEFGKFRIPVLSESKLRMNVCSQMDYFDHTYQQDSFCVDDVDALEQDSAYIPSVLTQMEDKLSYKKTKSKRLQTLSSSEDSSNDEKSTKSVARPKKKHRKRIMCFSSSDSDDAKT